MVFVLTSAAYTPSVFVAIAACTLDAVYIPLHSFLRQGNVHPCRLLQLPSPRRHPFLNRPFLHLKLWG